MRSIGILSALFLVAKPLLAICDPLPSWNEGPNKQAIIDFVRDVTEEGSSKFIPVPDRIAVFDNDGTLWAEQPSYFQALFAIDRVKALAPQHPEWKTKEPFKSILTGDLKTAFADKKNVAALVLATHSGMTIEEFEAIVLEWIATARHPKTGKPYNQMIYKPMLEVLNFLRANNFKTYIVSGGGVEFMRPWVEKAYGIPPEQVVGSRGELKYEVRDGNPVLIKVPELDFIDDGPGKPVGIQHVIGRRPVMAFGNSDGDLQMLQWTCSAKGPRFCLYVHHTDAEREWAYDKGSSVGALEKGLVEAKAKNWTVVDMKADWNAIFPLVTLEEVKSSKLNSD